MQVAVLGCGYHKQQFARLAVERLVVDAVWHGHGRKPSLADGFGLGVGNGDAVSHGSRALLLAGENCRLVLVTVVQVARRFVQRDKLVDRFCFILR